jgi:hypothetical protein
MIEPTLTYQQAADLATSNQDLAIFFFDPECEFCAGFIPDAVNLLKTIIDQVHIVNARQSPFPPAHLPCTYLYRQNHDVPLIKVGVGPMDLVENDFRQFYGKI